MPYESPHKPMVEYYQELSKDCVVSSSRAEAEEAWRHSLASGAS